MRSLPPPGRLRRGALLLLAATLAACGDEPGENVYAALRLERSQLGDTTVVRTVEGSVWRDTMLLVPEMSIGVLDGADPYVFGRIRGIALDPQGRIYIVDGQAKELRVFSPTGEHIRSIGRPGEGPGEFRQPDQVSVASDGRLVVRDAPLRFSLFDPNGDYLGGWPLGSGYSTNAPFYLDPEDRLLNPTFFDRLVRYDLDGTGMDTLPVPTRGYQAPMLNVSSGGGRASYSIPFMPHEWWAMTRDGSMLFGLTDRYAIDRLSPDGGVLRIERFAEPIPVASREAAQARENVLSSIRSFNDADFRWEGPDIPATKPPYLRVIPGVDGTIWVLRATAGVEEENPRYDPAQPGSGPRTFWREQRIVDVFDAEGSYLGPVKIPAEMDMFAPPVLSAERVVAAAMHADGYPQVVGYRLEPATGR